MTSITVTPEQKGRLFELRPDHRITARTYRALGRWQQRQLPTAVAYTYPRVDTQYDPERRINCLWVSWLEAELPASKGRIVVTDQQTIGPVTIF